MLSISLSGCDELEALNKPDYITVTIVCDTHVQAAYSDDNRDIMPVIDAKVNVVIVKDGGERVEENVETDYKGDCDRVTATFKLYNKQSIDAFANLDHLSV